MRAVLILLAVALAACTDNEEARAERLREARRIIPTLDEPQVQDRAVELGEVQPFIDATGLNFEPEIRQAACFVLGRLGGARARAHLGVLVRRDESYALRRAAALALADPENARARREAEAANDEEAAALIVDLEQPEVFDQIVEMRAVGALIVATAADQPDRVRRLACVALGKAGGDEARNRLLTLLEEDTKNPLKDGPLHLYAAVGLTLVNDPGTAIDLLLNLSRINPNDNLAARGAENMSGPYFTIDAQLCDALLGMGLWTAEEELVEQLRRRHRIRVLIDAHAVLRRRTGLDLPFRYNGSYAARAADADAWLEKLRATRAEREKKHPLDAKNPRLQQRCRDMMAWLGGQSVNDRYIAHKVILRVGSHALPYLEQDLKSKNPIAQRQAALMLGRIGDPAGAPALRKALTLADADARAEAISALRKLGDKDARVAVRARLQDMDAEVRAVAAHFLEDFGTKEDVPALQAALEAEKAPATVTRIACALLLLGDKKVVPRLVEVFIKGEQHDREAALACLEKAAGEKAAADALAPAAERAAAAEAIPGWFR